MSAGYVYQVVRPRPRDVRKDGFRKIAVRIEQRDALAGPKNVSRKLGGN
jgi:hypothetical protein